MVQQLYVNGAAGVTLPMGKNLRQYQYGEAHFIWMMARRLNERRKMVMEPKAALAEANLHYSEFIKSESIQFGDPNYDWTPEAAFDLADELTFYDDVEGATK